MRRRLIGHRGAWRGRRRHRICPLVPLVMYLGGAGIEFPITAWRSCASARSPELADNASRVGLSSTLAPCSCARPM
jgi:hypothetical protein